MCMGLMVDNKDYFVIKAEDNFVSNYVIYDQNHEVFLSSVPFDSFDTSHIAGLIKTANDFYNQGVKKGKDEKMKEIRSVLGIEEQKKGTIC